MTSQSTSSTTLYHYPGCDTCRKARRFLTEHEVAFDAVHLVEQTPDVETLRSLWQGSGLPLRKLFNTAGRSYRDGGFKDRLAKMSEDEALAALAADGMLIKRPIWSTKDRVFVGFRPDAWAESAS